MVSGFLLDERAYFVLVKTVATPKGKYYYTFRVIWEYSINLAGFLGSKIYLIEEGDSRF